MVDDKLGHRRKGHAHPEHNQLNHEPSAIQAYPAMPRLSK
jgi:hypothetical protein